MAAGAEQFGLPARRAGRIGVPARARRGVARHLPPHAGGRQVAFGIEADEEQRHAVPFARQAQPARGGEVERARIARQLPDHRGKVAAAHRLFQREQHVLRILRLDMDQPVAQPFRQAGAIGAPGQPDGAAFLHPQHRAPILRLGQRPRFGPGAAQLVERERQCGRPARAIARGSENLAVQRHVAAPRLPVRAARAGQAATGNGRHAGNPRTGRRSRDGSGIGHGESISMFYLCSNIRGLAIAGTKPLPRPLDGQRRKP